MKKICVVRACLFGRLHFLRGRFCAVLILQATQLETVCGHWPCQRDSLRLPFSPMNQRLTSRAVIVENQISPYSDPVLRELDSTKESSGVLRPLRCSCLFGILLGSKVIKLIQEGIRLKAVEIGGDYLSLDYGRGMDIRNIRLIHSSPDSAVLEGVIEKFRYETGITPTVTH